MFPSGGISSRCVRGEPAISSSSLSSSSATRCCKADGRAGAVAFVVGRTGSRGSWAARVPDGMRCRRCAASNRDGATPSSDGANFNADDVWRRGGFPSYMQNEETDFCKELDDALAAADPSVPERDKASIVWENMIKEAQRDAESEPLLSSFLYASILAHDSFDRALGFVLANRLANATLLPTQLFEIISNVFMSDYKTLCCAVSDVMAVRERDPACSSYSSALLYFKGFQALQVHRVAHTLWNRGQRVIALTLQSRVSEVYAMDIHPAARIGCGVLIDHGTGVVIGETAVVGDNVSLLQNVTLGGTGKEVGDRHPKIEDNVLIGASATVLGNITIGKGAQVAAGSLVLKSVPPHTMVAGSPAKIVGKVSGNPALQMEQWSKKFDPFCDLIEGALGNVKNIAREMGSAVPVTRQDDYVQSTMDDEEAERLWPVKPEPEYFI